MNKKKRWNKIDLDDNEQIYYVFLSCIIIIIMI